MKLKLFYNHKDFKKGKVAVAELKRAHLIIALLAVSLAFLIVVSSVYPIQLDELLAGVAAALLIIVAAVSLCIALMLPKK